MDLGVALVSNQDPNFTPIDPVNYVRKSIPTAAGEVEIEGLTVRSLVKALQAADPDDLVCYMAEMTPELREVDCLIGATAGLLCASPHGVCFIVGPESVRAMKGAGMVP